MSPDSFKRAAGGVFCAVALMLAAGTPVSEAAFDDPLAVIRPVNPGPPEIPLPPPDGDLEGPCGVAVDADGNFYVSDYHRNAIDVFDSALNAGYPYGYQRQATGIVPLNGPCGLAFDGDGNLYVNGFHRSVLKYGRSLTVATVVSGDGSADGAHPTGVGVNQASGAVYVTQRTRIAVFSAAGTPIGTLAASTLEDGYGVAVSEFAGSEGLVYVADAASETVKVYSPEPLDPDAAPVAEIDGLDTPLGHFVSLRDAALAIDRATGELYVSDNLQPEFAERPETVIHVFSAVGIYEGRLKHSIENAIPPGLAVDNSAGDTQGRVFVTSGNTERAAIYAYPPGAATSVAVPVPSSTRIVTSPLGSSGVATAAVGSAALAESAGTASPTAAPLAAERPTKPRKHRRAHKRKRAQKRQVRNRVAKRSVR